MDYTLFIVYKKQAIFPSVAFAIIFGFTKHATYQGSKGYDYFPKKKKPHIYKMYIACETKGETARACYCWECCNYKWKSADCYYYKFIYSNALRGG